MAARPGDPVLARTLGLVVGGVAAGGLLAFRLWGRMLEHLARCPLRDATGIPCPTCGGTHAALALAHGHLSRAWRENPLVSAAALLAALWFSWALVASLWPPARRWWPRLGPRAARWLARLALAAVVVNWLYEFHRLAR